MSTKMQVKWLPGHAQTPKTRAQKRDRKKGRENMQNVSKNEPTDATKGTQNGAQGGHLGTPGVSKGVPIGTLGLCRAPQDLKRPSPVPQEPPETLSDPIFNTFLHISLKSPLRSFLIFPETLIELSSVLAALRTVTCRLFDVCPGSAESRSARAVDKDDKNSIKYEYVTARK